MIFNRATVLLGCLFTLSSSFSVNADDSAYFDERTYLSDLPVVISASRLEQPELEAPGAVTVLDRDDIISSGARTIPELFYQVPGFQVGRFTGSEYVVASHGFSDHYSRRLQVLVDGRSIYTPAFGGIVWESLPIHINDIERVEIIRGPNATLYGSNAFNAVINITTRFAAGTTPQSISYTHEDRDNYSGHASASIVESRYEIGMNANYRENSGFGKIPSDQTTPTNPNTGQPYDEMQDSIRSRAANIMWRYQASTQLEISSDMGLLDAVRDFGDGVIDDPYRDMNIDSDYYRVRFDYTSDHGNHLSLQAFHSAVDLQDGDAVVPLSVPFDNPALGGGVDVSTSFKEVRQEIELQFTPELDSNLRLVMGGSYRKDTIEGEQGRIFRDDKSTLNLGRIFINSEWHASQDWILGAGVMAEDHEHSGSSYSPKLSAIYKVTPHQAFRVIASRAYRTPTAWEEEGILRFYLPVQPLEQLISQATGMPIDFPADRLDYQAYQTEGNLENEEITSFELGYKFVPNENTKLDIRLFREDIDDMIAIYSRPFDLVAQGLLNNNQIQTIEGLNNTIGFDSSALTNAIGSGNAYNFRNLVDIDINGLELEGEHAINDSFQILGGFAWLDSQIERYADPANGIVEDNMENNRKTLNNSVPEYSGFIGGRFTPTNNHLLALTFYHFDEYEWHGAGDDDLGETQFFRLYAQATHEYTHYAWKMGVGAVIRAEPFRDIDNKNAFQNHLFSTVGVDF
ncbi:TonB-dependent receptor [gamma proteobacterium HTCC5015]|nr:TonB-dependent receptor [gamma proteobacterium HTCC5015]